MTYEQLLQQHQIISKMPKSSRYVYDAIIGDIITGGYRLYLVKSLLLENGRRQGSLKLMNIQTGEERITTTLSLFKILDVEPV